MLIEEIQGVGNTTDEVNTKRFELVRLSEFGELSQSVKYLKKGSAKAINKIHAEDDLKRMERVQICLAGWMLLKTLRPWMRSCEKISC